MQCSEHSDSIWGYGMATKANKIYNSAKNLKLDGYKRQIYFERLLYGTPNRTHQVNKYSLWKWYSALRNWLPTQFEEKIIEKKYSKSLDKIFEDYKIVHSLYMSSFEGMGTCSPEEKNFEWAMNVVFFQLDKITADVGALDGVGDGEQEEIDFVNPH